jgi:hypothetical protein
MNISPGVRRALVELFPIQGSRVTLPYPPGLQTGVKRSAPWQSSTSNCRTAEPMSRSKRPALRASTQKYIRPGAALRPSAVVTPSHEKLVSVRQPRNTIPFAFQRNSIGGVPPSAVAVKVYISPPRTTGSAVLGKSLARVTRVTSLVGGSGDVTCGASGDEPHERAQMQASGVEAYVILLMSTLMIHWMLSLVLRSLLIVLCLPLAGCGGEPASPSSPSPTGPAPLVTLSTGTPSAELLVATNAPGKFRYSLGYSIRLPEPLWTRVVTIRRFELWLIGEDGTVHDNRVLGSYEGEKLGGPGFSGPIGKSGGLVAPDDPNITRPPAATYRLSLEYILDNETDTHVVTTESPVTCRRWRSTPL